MTAYIISSGQTTSYSLVNGDSLTVLSGGVSDGSVVGKGASETVSLGGLSELDTVMSGGVLSGAGVVSGLIDSGLAAGVTVKGSALIYGEASGVTVATFGALEIKSGGIESGSTLTALGGEYVLSGGTAKGTTVLANGGIAIDVGATAVGVDVSSGGYAFVAGVVSSGQSFTDQKSPLTAKTTFNGVTVSSGGNLTLEATHVESGGTLTLGSGTISDGLVVEAGGVLKGPGELGSSLFGVTSHYGITSDYGVVSGVQLGGAKNTFSTGVGELLVFGGGVAENVIVTSGTMEVMSRGTASATELDGANVLTVELRGVVSGTQVAHVETAPGATVDVYGSSLATVVSSGGAEVVFSKGAATGATVLNGGVQIADGGSVIGTVVSSGGLLSGGEGAFKTTSAMVLDGGVEAVVSGGVATNTTVASGGAELLASGGAAKGGTVIEGGMLSGAGVIRGNVDVYGEANTFTVTASSHLVVESGGLAETVKLASSATLNLSSGGEADNIVVLTGATVVDNGVLDFSGTATQTVRGTLSAGGVIEADGPGELVISADASAFRGQLALNGGTVELAVAGGLGKGSVLFGAGASAKALDVASVAAPASGGAFAQTLTDFVSSSDTVDLLKRAFVAGATAAVKGSVLTLTDGAYTATFKLSGGQAATYTVASDGSGGTEIGVGATGAAAMVQAIAGFGVDAAAPVSPHARDGSRAPVVLAASALTPRHALA